jgi:hypothetical protein
VARHGVKEVNVEDPSPAFQALRNLNDMQFCQKFGFYQRARPTRGGRSKKAALALPKSLVQWDEQYALQVQQQLKISMVQVRRCFDAFRYACIDKTNEATLRAHRLQIKRRIYAEREEELSIYFTDKPELKRQLQTIYAKEEQGVIKLLHKLERTTPL